MVDVYIRPDRLTRRSHSDENTLILGRAEAEALEGVQGRKRRLYVPKRQDDTVDAARAGNPYTGDHRRVTFGFKMHEFVALEVRGLGVDNTPSQKIVASTRFKGAVDEDAIQQLKLGGANVPAVWFDML